MVEVSMSLKHLLHLLLCIELNCVLESFSLQQILCQRSLEGDSHFITHKFEIIIIYP